VHRFAPPLLLAVFAAVTAAAPVPPATEQPKAAPAKRPPTPEQIAQAIRNLGSERFAVREQASKLLWEAGSAAEEALRQAARTSDAEVAQRAKAILEKFDWGLYPDTPQAVTEIIDQYQKGDGGARTTAVRNLLGLRPIPFKTLRKLIGKEENAEQRVQLFHDMASQARQEVPDLLLRGGDLDTVEELLESCLAPSVSESATDYAAFLALRGKVDAGIARWEKERAAAQGADSERAAEVLVHLYRVKGDWAGARKAAEQSKNAELLDDVLWESRNWQELAARPPGADRAGNQLGVRAAIYRLAGDRAKFEETIAELRKQAEEAGEDQATPRFAAEALLLNSRADDAIKLLVEKKNSLALAFDLLCARMKHKAAFDLVDDARRRDTEPAERNEIEVRRARMLYLLGEKEAASQLFRKAAENIHEASDLHLARTLVKTELRLGLREQAFEHAAAALGNLVKVGQHDGYNPLFEPLFDKNSSSAERWWRVLRTQLPKEEALQIMQRLRDLLEGKATKERLGEAVKWMEASKETKEKDPLSDGTSNTIHLTEPGVAEAAIAEVYRAAGDGAKAEEYYRKAAEAGITLAPWLQYGDFLASRKRYREAAKQYHSAWEHNKSQPLGLYLEGRALLQAGDDREGKRLIELAHWVPLGNESVRCNLVEELAKRDWLDAARKEADFVLQTGWYRPANWPIGNVLSFAARLATQEKDYLKAADCYERGLLGCLRTGASFVEPTAYLSVPEAVRVNRARGLLDKGQVDEALKDAKANLEAMPGNIDLAIALVPDLDKVGRKKEADELYRQVRAAYEGLAKDYPTSGYARNSLAWLMALCRRDLDEARKQSEKAVELEPKNAGYIDTLAEVHFRQGNRDKAIDLMKQCLAMEGKNSYFQKQLERFRTKGFDTPTPQEDDDGDE
jgi:tetratricopeptide (TPR) repeat protein